MDYQTDPEQSGGALQETDTYLRENPIPALLGALAVGFAIGLLARALEPKPRPATLQDHLKEAEDYLQSVWHPLAKKTRRAYQKSSAAVRETVSDAVDQASKIDVEDYTDPITKWFRQVWKNCCG